MSPSIEVDEEVFALLKDAAEPFTDTPNSVLRRLLAVDGASTRRSKSPRQSHPKEAGGSTKPTRTRNRQPRAAAGSILPEDEYVRPLLESLDELGGSAPSRDVIERVGKKLDDRLTEIDRAPLGSGSIRWHSRLQFVRLRLIDRGLMTREAPRGVWVITDKGRESVRESR